MQELALHVEHFKLGALSGLCRENTRTALQYKNNVDLSLSINNYSPSTGGPVLRKDYPKEVRALLLREACHVEKRKARGGRGGRPRSVLVYNSTGKAVRGDANYITSAIVTISRDTAKKWGPDKEKEYFKACVEFFENKYGNKIDDIVHVDEKDAGIHLHYNFVPLVGGVLNADKLFKKGTLWALHTELTQFLQGRGFEVVRGTDAREKGYTRTLRELRKKQELLAGVTSKEEKALANICNNAHYEKASSGFLGFGEEKPARYSFEEKDAQKLVELARAGVVAGEVLASIRKNDDKIEALAKENSQLRQKLEQEKASSQELLEYSIQETRKKVLEENASDIKNGRIIKAVFPYNDLVKQVNEIVSEARRRTQERKKQEEKARALARQRARARSRDDDYSL
jgi:hypothetical protein